MLQDYLIEKCRENDRKAQVKLYKKYCDGMYYVAFRYLKNSFDAEEAIQEAFVKAYQKLHQYSGEVTFGAWLKKIVINKCIDFLKMKKLELTAINENTLSLVEEDEKGWLVSDFISVEKVKLEIEQLPERYKYVVMLYLMEGYDHQEISQILGITEITSRTLLHRGKQKLREKLKTEINGTGY